VSSFVGQMFMGEKECLVTMDRFLWHRGIQKCDVKANDMRKECMVCELQLHAQLLWWVGLDQLCWHNFENNRHLKELGIMLE